MNENKRIVKISKLLSYVLRHRPEKFGIKLDKNGWATVKDIMDNCRDEIDFNFEDLKEIVRTSDKQRFKLSDDYSKIKANQGHSVKVDLNLKPITPPNLLYHGTAFRFVEKIKKEGLKKMNRHHIHLYGEDNIGKAEDTDSRHQKGKAPVVLTIDAKSMSKDGYKFYKTDNDVYLTDFVPKKYLYFTIK